MKIYECKFETGSGDIHHQVHVDWDSEGNLHFTEIDEGEGLKNGGIELSMNTFLWLNKKTLLSSSFIFYGKVLPLRID